MSRNLSILWTALVLLLSAATLPAQDAEYVQAYSLIDQADSLAEKGNADAAKAKYLEAQSSLLAIQKNYPKWNPSAVSFRLKYLNGKLAPKPAQVAEVPTPAPAPVATPPAPVTQAPSQAKPQAATNAKGKGKGASAPVIKLVEAGAEPRKPVRLQPKPGDKQSIVMTTQLGNMDMGMGKPMKMPAVKTTMELTVNAVSAEGDITYEMVTKDAVMDEDPSVSPQIVTAMKSSLDGFRGLAVTATLTSRGAMKTMQAKLPEGAQPQAKQMVEQMKQSFAHMTTAFPEEAIGAGAKWEVQAVMKSQGLTLDQTTGYELVSNMDNRMELKVTVTQTAAKQKIKSPAVPNAQVDLTSFSGSGDGNMTFDTTKVFPVLAALESRTEMSMTVEAGGKKQNLTMKMDMAIRIESK